jgi:hypothetical protein
MSTAEQITDEALLDRFITIMDEQKAATSKEIAALRHSLNALAQRTSRPPGSGPIGGAPEGDSETLGSRFVRDAGFLAWRPSHPGAQPASATFKTLLGGFNIRAMPPPVTNAGMALITRLPGIAPFPLPAPNFVDVLTWRPISDGNEVDYLRQTSVVSPGAGTQIVEGDPKFQQGVTVTLIKEPILTIASWTSASTQALSDLSSLQTFLDLVLMTAVKREIDRQVLVGVGPTAELKGIVSQAVAYNAAANQTGDTGLDQLSHAITQLSSTGVAVDVAVVNPGDAEKLRLIKTSLGSYILGDPSAMAATPNLWGIRIIVDANMPPATFLAGQSTSVEILDREQSMIAISFEHEDYFTRNLCAIRCEARLGLGVYVPSAWVSGTFVPGALAAAAAEQHGKK